MRVKVIKRVGDGSYTQAFTDDSSPDAEGRVVAVKQSHITKHIANPMLLHEACVLSICAGHPAFPTVHAWGRSQYFEYLVMYFLGDSLGQLVHKHKRINLHSSLLLVDQMLDALHHLHSHNLIHRDIKPDNLLLGVGENAGRVHLIDFGFAHYIRDPLTNIHRPLKEKQSCIGTLYYSSLTHMELSLSRRDDLQSLVYSIAYMLRGSLPWQCIRGGTEKNRESRYQDKKRAWTGLRLFEGFPNEFADFADYVRDLQYEEDPDYDYWKAVFKSRFNSLGFSNSPGFNPDSAGVDDLAVDYPLVPAQVPESRPKIPPVTKGQYILIRVLPSASIEGPGRYHNGDKSQWHDPSLQEPRWRFPFRPFLVADVATQLYEGYWTKLIPLIYKPGELTEEEKKRFIRIGEDMEGQRVVTPSPAWDLEDMYHAGPPRLITIHVEPAEEKIQTHWKLYEDQIQRLTTFMNEAYPPTEELSEEAQSIIRNSDKIQHQYDMILFGEVKPFTSAHADISSIDPQTLIGAEGVSWSGPRALLEEGVQLHRRYSAENGCPWPEDRTSDDEDDQEDLSDDGFCPNHTWYQDTDSVPQEDVLGDWKATLKNIAILNQVPQMHERIILNQDEKMVTYD
ncbi:kinase-like protein [Pluteus cervinus]|uniref:Kinase-like protein n=1 Tax=Pluteus cervinus TaxID=181527 RepID=A0ACD3AT97_9AGAR|nr:kinase-like protein [Pluteus cervinus]